MYEAHYGLVSKPFQLNPDPQFYFGSKQHQRAKAYLEYGLHQGEGFIVVTGEVGAGKTTVVRGLINQLDPTQVIAANVVSAQLDALDILRMVCSAFGVDAHESSKSGLLIALEARLNEHRKAGRRCLLIVDEAQHLSYSALEELRMLSNFQFGTHALLQSFLVGQPEFREVIFGPRMLQLRQRIIASCHIDAMDANETRGYIVHRLKCSGANDWPLFTDEAFPAIHQASGGIPRRINMICDRVLLSGMLAERSIFGAKEVVEVADEIALETSLPSAEKRSQLITPDISKVPANANGSRAEMAPSGGEPHASPPESTTLNGKQVTERLDRLEGLMSRLDANHATALDLLGGLTGQSLSSLPLPKEKEIK